MTSMIQVDNLTFSYTTEPVLQSVSLNVMQGEITAIVGPNGVGKTTLLKCLCRIVPVRDGRVEICGKPLASYSQKQLASLIGYVPQTLESMPLFTVWEFIRLSRYPYKTPFGSWSRTDEKAVDEAMKWTQTKKFSRRHLGDLSGGERQRVLIAAALAQEPAIMLLDEPISFLDPRHQVEVFQLLKRINRDRRMTIVLVTHDINNTSLCADRVLALKEGKVAFDSETALFMKSHQLQSLYDVSFDLLSHPETGKPVAFQKGML